MPKRIVFIGAGSYSFTRGLVRDMMTYPALQDAELVLEDISDEKLELAKRMVMRIIEAGKFPAKVICTKDPAEALTGADGVLCTISVRENDEICKTTIDIPKKHGLSLASGDTIGPAGTFHYLMTVNALIEICRNIEKYCPNAVFLNYTNPMSMLSKTMQTMFPKLTIIGLCHSVQEAAAKIAGWIGADVKDLSYTCAGINHFSFFTDLKLNGTDAYPLLKEAMQNPEIYEQENINFELMKYFGHYSPESSSQKCNFVPWFRNRPDLIKKYCTFTDNGVTFTEVTQERRAQFSTSSPARKKELSDWFENPVDLNRGKEYAACIFNAIFGDNTLFEFNGNVRNFGLIDNLPQGACVEVPMVASKKGIEAIHVGKIPPQLAAMIDSPLRCQELAVEAVVTNDKEKIYQACMLDPLAGSVMSLEEIHNMVDEMFNSCAELHPFKD